MELAEEGKDVGSGGADEEESDGPEVGGKEEDGRGGKEDGGGGRMLEMIELRVLKISPGSDEEGGVGGLEIGVSEVGVAEVGSTTWLVMEATWLVTGATSLVTSLTTDPTTLVRSLTTEPTTLVRPPRRPPSSDEDEDAGGDVIEAESDVEVGVPDEAESVMETGSKTLVVDDDGPGSTSETTLLKPLPTPSTILEIPPSTPPRRPPSLEDEGAGVTEESEAVEVNELVSVEAGSELLELVDESVGDEALLLLLPPSPSKSKVRNRNFTPSC